jgi:hypothetical protein
VKPLAAIASASGRVRGSGLALRSFADADEVRWALDASRPERFAEVFVEADGFWR